MNFSEITENLWIGTTPKNGDYDLLCQLGVKLVINMRMVHKPSHDLGEQSLHCLWLRTVDSPIIPIPVQALRQGVQAALEVIGNGGKVYVHCAGGRHRSVAMGAAILIAQGLSPESAMALIKAQRSVADPYIFYIHRRIKLFARKWSGK